MRFYRAFIATTRGGDEDCAVGVSSLTNEEPLVVVKARIDIVWEVVREDCSDSRGGVIRKGEAPLRRGRGGNIRKGTLGAENGDISCNWSSGAHQGSEVFASRRGDEDIVGVDSDIFVERGKQESVEYFLGYAGRCGRHD